MYIFPIDVWILDQYAVREAAKTAGIWEKDPHISIISPRQLDVFHKAVKAYNCVN